MTSDDGMVALRRLGPGIHRLAIMGRLGSLIAGQLDEAVEEAIRAGTTRVQIDLSTARVVEPDDLLCLVDVHRHTSRRRVTVELVNVPPQVAEQMSRTLLPALLPIG